MGMFKRFCVILPIGWRIPGWFSAGEWSPLRDRIWPVLVRRVQAPFFEIPP